MFIFTPVESFKLGKTYRVKGCKTFAGGNGAVQDLFISPEWSAAITEIRKELSARFTRNIAYSLNGGKATGGVW